MSGQSLPDSTGLGSSLRRVGPYSRPQALQRLDGRTREARLLRQVRKELTEHVGGKPSATQRALIDRAAWLSLRVAQLDGKTAEGGQMTEHDARTYLAWSNTLTRTLRQLGTKSAEAAPRSLDALRAAHARGTSP